MRFWTKQGNAFCGHVAPERVAQDLPPLVAILRKHGLEVPMITADIVDTSTPFTEDILKTMAALKIRNALEKVYRDRDKLTKDVGGKAGTSEFADSVIEAMQGQPQAGMTAAEVG